MIRGLDSSFSRPTPTQALAMYNAGVRVYGIYGATRSNVGLAAPWTYMDAKVLLDVGMRLIMFLSGNDDPVAAGNLARSWNAMPCLDDEDGIRTVGTWEQGWVDAAQSGIYGLLASHANVAARFHIVANYPGYDPQATWFMTPPDGPHGWQWQGTHDEFGLSVDSLWLDDWFGVEMLDRTDPVVQEIIGWVQGAYWLARSGFDGDPSATPPPAHYSVFKDVPSTLANIQSSLAGMAPGSVDVNALATALASHPLTATLTDVERDAIATHVLAHLAKDAAGG